MGFAFSYKTTEMISPDVQAKIIAAAGELAVGRTWLSCEPPLLMNYEGALYGASKPNFSPHPDDVASAKSEGLPDGTLDDVLDVLCELSRRFNLVWELAHDYSDGPIGYIEQGNCADEVRAQCKIFDDLADELGAGGFDLDELDL